MIATTLDTSANNDVPIRDLGILDRSRLVNALILSIYVDDIWDWLRIFRLAARARTGPFYVFPIRVAMNRKSILQEPCGAEMAPLVRSKIGIHLGDQQLIELNFLRCPQILVIYQSGDAPRSHFLSCRSIYNLGISRLFIYSSSPWTTCH